MFCPDTCVEVEVVNDTDGKGEVLEVLAETVEIHNRAEQFRLEEVASIGDGAGNKLVLIFLCEIIEAAKMVHRWFNGPGWIRTNASLR